MKPILAIIYDWLEKGAMKHKDIEYRKQFKIHPTARLGYLPHIILKGNIEIGPHSYFNSGRISTGKNSSVRIGEWCAIGYNVNIHAITHHPEHATGPEKSRPVIEGSIIIEDHVWIGSNTYIRPGITIGRNSIIGVNSVVTRDIPENAIVGGIPAKIIRFKKEIVKKIISNNEK